MYEFASAPRRVWPPEAEFRDQADDRVGELVPQGLDAVAVRRYDHIDVFEAPGCEVSEDGLAR